MEAIVELKNATKVVTNGFNEERVILDKVNLTIYQGDFITILGGNGAGKSTLFNVIAGTLPLTSGSVHILGEDVTNWPAEKRAKYLARVFQDPKMGTSPRMTVAENLLIAKYRGEGRGLVPRKLSQQIEEFAQLLPRVGNGLEKHLETPAGLLSGGQRQALSLLMASLKQPELLLLDEPMRRAIVDGLDANARNALAARAGMLSLYQDGLRKVAAGQTSWDEVMRVTQDQTDA